MAPPLCPATAAAAAAARAAAHPGSRSPRRPRREGRSECDSATGRGARSRPLASRRPSGWTVRGRSVAAALLYPLPGGRSGPSGRRRSLIPRHTQVRAGGGPGCLKALAGGGSGLGSPGGSPAPAPPAPRGGKEGLRPLNRASLGTAGCSSSRCFRRHTPSDSLLSLSREEPPREPCQAGGRSSFLSEIPPPLLLPS